MKRLLQALAGAVAWVGLAIGGTQALEVNAPQRFSLAISGGASKGAYEAGLNWAVLKLIRASEELGALSGGELRPIQLVSAAGASAGGVNTILSGLTWCVLSKEDGGLPNHVDDNFFRQIWLRIDINELLPPEADSDLYLPDDAMFSRRDYFASAETLRESWNQPAFRQGCSVPLGVTVTRVRPLQLKVGDIEVKNQRFYIPFELRVKGDGTVDYFFDPATYPTISDPAMILMPRPRSDPPYSISDDRIIEAATSTSAFPSAFGRRRFKYCRLSGSLVAKPDLPETQQAPTDLLCPQGYQLDEAEFADGGLFDNLPVGLARDLAEFERARFEDPFPVTYLYMDPDRIRYDAPPLPDKTACASKNPPKACRIMDFSLFSEAGLLSGALGTARKYELYREVTSDQWRLNLSQLAYELAEVLQARNPDFDCEEDLPYFVPGISCDEALIRSGNFLEIAYDWERLIIAPPYSVERMAGAGIVRDCVRSEPASKLGRGTACRIDIAASRDHLAEAMIAIMERAEVRDRRLYVSITRSRQSMHYDRVLRVSSRGAPITGTLLGDFGSFLDFKFREYDYYVGIYDALVLITLNFCSLQFSRDAQSAAYGECVQHLAEQLYDRLGITESPKARYVFARLAKWEFADQGYFDFAYDPQPVADIDMEIIHDALAKALEAGEERTEEEKSVFVTEDTFFEYLKSQGFEPTPTSGGKKPLLAEIIANPETWPTELTRRVTARLVYLERQAADLYAEREPEPELRETSYTELMGLSAYVLQSMTYTYPPFTFAPSTAPEDWFLRYVIPYEVSFDLVEGDFIAAWQPTVAMSKKDLVAARISLGFAGGLFNSSASRNRENYLGLGLGYTRRTGSATVSGVGFTPTWFHDWSEPEEGDQDTFGGDIHATFLSERLRVGIGSRDFRYFGQNWFLTIGLTDLPGAVYWLTR